MFNKNKFLGVINNMGYPDDISLLNNLGIKESNEPFIEINSPFEMKEPVEIREPQ
ncbi:hypothetical protein [Niallia sp. FSL R7-0271]|uniref:hypothetical protein n=1 Tax=Niallia sp. FSL R7-0271 TaxID=2921678 RepID=UPI0030FC574D